MATFKCPGCKQHFNNPRALGTHKRYRKTKITAVATKLLEQCNVNLEKKREKRARLESIEEEPEIQEEPGIQ